jgi:hypothetical protein
MPCRGLFDRDIDRIQGRANNVAFFSRFLGANILVKNE